MVGLFICVVLATIFISACCACTEAALLSVPLAHVRSVADSGSLRAKTLLKLKDYLGQPIAAILIVNTIATTVGTAVAGAMASEVYEDRSLVLIAIGFTLILLYLGQIIPKKIGAVYCRPISLQVALPLQLAINLLYPLVRSAEYITRSLDTDDETPMVTGDEVASLAEIGWEEGAIDHLEGSIIKNVIGLDRRFVKDILTPRVVVFRLADRLTLREIRDEIIEWNHTRVPIFSEENPDIVNRYVIQRDLFRSILRDDLDKTLKDFERSMGTIPELMRADKLLLQMFEQGEFICSVVDEHGGFAGLITLEDVIEELVGREIIDEYDLVGDLRSYAQILHHARRRRLGPEPEGS